MLGICNHWVSLLVHKLNSEIEFIFFDSRNVDYLTWSEKQIEDDIDEKDQIRIKNGRVPSTGFKKMIGMQAIKDIQRTLDLIGNCILGNTTLMKYHNDRRLEILYSSFLSEIPYLNKEFNNMNYNEIFNLKNKNLITIFEALNNWLICNYGSMKSFFSNFHDKNDLDEEYNLKLLKFLDYFRYLYKFMKEEKIWTKFSSRYPYLVRPIKISSLFDFSNL